MALLKLKPIHVVDFSTLIRAETPNTYLVCPSGFSPSEPDQEAPIFQHSRDTVLSAWMAMIEDQSKIEEIDNSSTGMQRTYVQRSHFFGFPDVITVEFFLLTVDTATLGIYSQSQYGHSDFGVNQRRIDAWLTDLAKRLN